MGKQIRCRFCGGPWETMIHIMNCGAVNLMMITWDGCGLNGRGRDGEGEGNGWLRLLRGKPDKTRCKIWRCLEHGRGRPGHITEVRRENVKSGLRDIKEEKKREERKTVAI